MFAITVVRTEIFSTFHARAEYIYAKNALFKPLGVGPIKLPTPSLRGTWTPSNTRMPKPSHSPRQTTAWLVHAFPHNYASESHLLQWDAPHLGPLPKLHLLLPRSPPHLIHPSLDRSQSPPRMASGSNQPFCHSILSAQFWQTDRQTDGHMG